MSQQQQASSPQHQAKEMQEKMHLIEEWLLAQQRQFQEQQECQCLLNLKNAHNEQLIAELRVSKDVSKDTNLPHPLHLEGSTQSIICRNQKDNSGAEDMEEVQPVNHPN
ncbi:hypothetical protein GOBAR_DD04987 [Gossypium barbadense]|nr:hypothetical protein GOBAR_DD04987 [Gossypium barbadense]